VDANLFRNLEDIPSRFRGGALEIGNFDGVHRGHARLVERLLAMAAKVGGPAVVFTFNPHPAQLLRPQAAHTPLAWTERNAMLLRELGVDAVVAFPTDMAFLQLDAEQFFQKVVRERLDARGMVEGANFYFGHNRSGTVSVLHEYCAKAGISLEVVDTIEINGQIVSSSRIRGLISSGWVDHAAELMGRPYRIRGQVVLGEMRGQRLGFPTANIERVDTLLPGEGVYAAAACWREGEQEFTYPAAVSIGGNPTFDVDTFKVEAHLIGYEGSLYDRRIELDFLARLRDCERFDSAHELITQMKLDVSTTRRIVDRRYRREEQKIES